MDESGYYRMSIDKMMASASDQSHDPSPLRYENHGKLNGGADGSPKVQMMPPTSREKMFANLERSKNNSNESFGKKTEKKRPTTFMERLKWLKKFPNANMRKPKASKSTESANFKNSLGRRKNFQHPKMFGVTLANGNHDASKPNLNETKDFEMMKNANVMPKAFQSPVVNKNSLLKPIIDIPLQEDPEIQHPTVQSSVTYKCRKCSRTFINNLEMLKEHQINCSSQYQAPTESTLESDQAGAVPGNSKTVNRNAKQFVLCSACGTYFEYWNIFIHMRDVHHRLACLYCLGLFSNAEKLSAHLMTKHNSQVNCFKSKEEVVDKFPDTFYLVCCKCDVFFTQKDNYANHECNQMNRLCLACDTKGGHKPDCPKTVKHKYSGSSDLESGKKSKKSVPHKQVFDPSVSVLPVMDVNNLTDRSTFPGFDIKSEKDVPDLSLLDGIGVNELNALSYGMPEVKSEKISPSSMALLIEEVKNCLAQPPPPPISAISETNKELENEKATISKDSTKHDDASISITESQATISELNKSNPDVSNSNFNCSETNAQPNDSRSAPADKETNRVPKLTVKVPKIIQEKKEVSDYSSDSEDSDKLTVDLEPKPEETYVNNLENNTDENVNDKKDVPQEDETAGDDIPIIELTLDQPLDKYPLKDLLQVLLNGSIYSCIYCNHARRIAVNGKQLGLHFISQHKFTATVNSITAEELLPETIVSKIRTCLSDVEDVFINLDDFPGKTELSRPISNYECFQCYFITPLHKDLYFHNRKMHQKTILLCIMCKSNFYTYSELICHLCPGMYLLDCEILFRCCICQLEPIPSAFRLMVHLRKRHHACDVCLEICYNQSKLSSHVWKHKLHHLCYRCGISYRNKTDITKHLFWKHGTESVLCKKCLQRKWPHVYHFCVPPNLFTCEECNINFTKAVYLKVHKRTHAGDFPYDCKEPDCTEKFISKKLLLKHTSKHSETLDSEKNLNSLDKSSNISEIIDLCDKSEVANSTDTKTKKNKKSKSYKDNLLIDVNLPALNLSESGSSDDSDTETNKKSDLPSDSVEINDNSTKNETSDETKPEPPVQGVWDNFKLYQESLEKQIEKPHIPVHVCESDHDYCVIPSNESPDVEIIGEIKAKSEPPVSEIKDSPKKKNKLSKKKNKSDTVSSSSDSSSDSDSSCSCGTNCSCSSSSGSSSSSSSSDSSSSESQKRRPNVRKDSDASHNSAVDIMATEESPSHLISKIKEMSYAESDLDSEESATDEDFYDKHPQRIANKLLAEKRNQLIQSTSTSPVNNGSYLEMSRPSTPNSTDKVQRKKVKVKKRKKEKKNTAESFSKTISNSPNIPMLDQSSVPNKITISLQSNTVQIQEGAHISDSAKGSSGALSDADSKRASKRRRVPNKFYGYSSDEEFMLKPHLPPKLEWRKEDLPSPSVIPISSPMEVRVPEISVHVPTSIMPMKSPPKESSSEDSDSSKEGVLQIKEPYSPIPREPENGNKLIEHTNPLLDSDVPFPRPTGAREAREGESVYCYCRCPYDEVSEMIACDAKGCSIEWFHFECVGIMVPPKGQWYCPDCRVKQDNLHK